MSFRVPGRCVRPEECRYWMRIRIRLSISIAPDRSFLRNAPCHHSFQIAFFASPCRVVDTSLLFTPDENPCSTGHPSYIPSGLSAYSVAYCTGTFTGNRKSANPRILRCSRTPKWGALPNKGIYRRHSFDLGRVKSEEVAHCTGSSE